jgi:hypothetical protein
VNVTDYLIDPADKDWSRLLAPWVPPLPPRFTVWLINRLGEAFVVDEAGAVLRLDVGAGLCAPVARSREQFAQLLDAADATETWLRVSLVDGCRRGGMRLGPFECYGFRIPPTLGGGYEVGNLVPTNLAVHYSYQAYICKQDAIYWIPPG